MKEIKIMVAVLVLSLMYQFAGAQTSCKGNNVLMSIGGQGCGCHCKKKCVTPAEVQTYLANGWHYGDCFGSCCWVRLNSDSSTLKIALKKNYPDPASGSTTISFSLSQAGKVSLKIFDLNGRLVSTLADKIFKEGENELMWSTENVNRGIYFLQVQSEEDQGRIKVVVTK